MELVVLRTIKHRRKRFQYLGFRTKKEKNSDGSQVYQIFCQHAIRKTLVFAKNTGPVDYPTISVKGKRRPANPPSIFGVPKSCLPQTYYSSSRDVDTRKVSSEARTRQTTTVPSPVDPDIIQTWESLKEHCKTLDYIIDASEDEINLYKVEGTLPKIVYSLNIDSKFHVSAFKGNTRIETRDLIASFSYRLNRYSQITTIHREA